MILDVHPGSGFFSIPDLGAKKAPDPGSGSATLCTTQYLSLNKFFMFEIMDF
jgi:hypothetical protein